MQPDPKAVCEVCGFESHSLAAHLIEAHGLTVQEYQAKYPDAEVLSPRATRLFMEAMSVVTRDPIPEVRDVKIDMAGVKSGINFHIPLDVCLPCPPAYRWPTQGQLRWDIQEAVVSILNRRHTYIWGMPGAGKDAFIHALSAQTRRPAIMKSIVPGRDIAPWFYSRSVNRDGTYWEYGEVWHAVTEGYKDRNGVVHPYIILITDLDRADSSQIEWLRLLMDGISGRMMGPDGKIHAIVPGTTFVATANTAGGGDERGRMVSARPIDASILDRFQRRYKFSYMEWEDEVEVCKEKFPELFRHHPNMFKQMGHGCAALRDAVAKETIYAEFSHRGVCSVLEHAGDMIRYFGYEDNTLARAFRVWLDGLPDESTRFEARRILSPHIKGVNLE